MELEKAKEILGNPEDIREIILRYFSGKLGDQETMAKNTLLQETIKRNTQIDIRELVLPINSICYACNGIGMLYKFYQKTHIVPCPDCEGTGTYTIKCNKCENGSIIYKRDGRTIVIKCDSCKGTGIHFQSSCRRCIGTGKIKEYERIEIKSSRLCPLCKGTGQYKDRNKLSNPIMSAKQALMIK